MKYVLFLFLLAGFTKCQSVSSKSDNNSDSISATTQKAGLTGSGSAKGSEITVTLTGGPNAGTYTITSDESTCSMGLTGEKSFGNQFSQTGKTDKELSSVQLIATNYEEAKKGTNDFTSDFTFGSIMAGKNYSLNPAKNIGTGKLTITETGSARTATIEGTTKEGVGIKATITCRTTQVMENGQLKEK